MTSENITLIATLPHYHGLGTNQLLAVFLNNNTYSKLSIVYEQAIGLEHVILGAI
jgi:hypothetical protein